MVLEDNRLKKELYNQGLLLKDEYPIGESNLSLEQTQLSRFSPFSSRLIVPKTLVDENDKRREYITGKLKSSALFSHELRPSTPNYLKGVIPKSKQQQRKKQLSRSPRVERMSTDEQAANEKRLRLIQQQLQFLRNPRFTEA